MTKLQLKKLIESFARQALNEELTLSGIQRKQNLGSVRTDGYIDSFVTIRDDYDEETLYKALTSSFMRVCINLHHRNDIGDQGWTLYQDGVTWAFGYKRKCFVFVSTDNTFDIYVDPDNVNVENADNFIHVLHKDHSHCTNAHDVNEILEANEYQAIDGQYVFRQNRPTRNRPAEERINTSDVKGAVKQAIVNELKGTIATAVKDSVKQELGSILGGSFSSGTHGVKLDSGDVNVASDNVTSGVQSSLDIDRIVEAVMKALKEKINPGTVTIKSLIEKLYNDQQLSSSEEAVLDRATDVCDAIIEG